MKCISDSFIKQTDFLALKVPGDESGTFFKVTTKYHSGF